MLRVEGLSRRFGGVYALKDVSFSVGPGEFRGIIGPNGAGKSTLFNLIAGHLPLNGGRILLRTPIGLLCLCAGLALDVVGGLWMRTIATIDA